MQYWAGLKLNSSIFGGEKYEYWKQKLQNSPHDILCLSFSCYLIGYIKKEQELKRVTIRKTLHKTIRLKDWIKFDRLLSPRIYFRRTFLILKRKIMIYLKLDPYPLPLYFFLTFVQNLAATVFLSPTLPCCKNQSLQQWFSPRKNT